MTEDRIDLVAGTDDHQTRRHKTGAVRRRCCRRLAYSKTVYHQHDDTPLHLTYDVTQVAHHLLALMARGA